MAYYYPQSYPQNYSQYQPQNGGIVRVNSEEDARRYPVALGYSVTFIDESGEKLYVKTAGFSQFDAPRFDKYRLIKENEPIQAVSEQGDKNIPQYATKAELEALEAKIEALRGELNG